MRSMAMALVMIGGSGLAKAADAQAADRLLFDLEDGAVPPGLTCNSTTVAVVPQGNGRALKVDFAVTDWPNVFFSPAEGGPWDFSAWAGIAVDLYNPEAETVPVSMRVDNAGADGLNHCNTVSTGARPGEWVTLEARFNTGGSNPFWGMRGVPELGPVPTGPVIDPARIVAFQVFLARPTQPHTLRLDNVRVFGVGAATAGKVPLPFVDRFGQYTHAQWPGKIATEDDLRQRAAAERAALDAATPPAGLDRYGGWAEGPHLEATGWFRTQRVDGRWWLVTPEGHLFFSVGVDCVGTWERTFVEQREAWFEWLPAADDPVFGRFFETVSGAHSMADPVGGKGRTFSFYNANLRRRYGDDWPAAWRTMAYQRLRSWGFNTVANWSQQDVLDQSPMPFVGSLGVSGAFRRIEGGTGYWAKMVDVFDPAYALAVAACLRDGTSRYAANPLCIGFFVDNEMAWQGIPEGVLASPPDQPCRKAFVETLRKAYTTPEALATAWDTPATPWDALRAPATPNGAARRDLDAFTYQFARRYFDTVNTVLKQHAPHQLFLGCRFAGSPGEAVLRACAEVADIVSFNLYYTAIDAKEWSGDKDLGKPLIVGEFHFGALDRGMFHTGLVPTRDQNERAASYARYVRSVADCPAFVGCHWFQYVDEPITGRWFDGENYNIGFVDVTDTPYPELTAAAREVHAGLYARRYGQK